MHVVVVFFCFFVFQSAAPANARHLTHSITTTISVATPRGIYRVQVIHYIIQTTCSARGLSVRLLGKKLSSVSPTLVWIPTPAF